MSAAQERLEVLRWRRWTADGGLDAARAASSTTC